MIGVLGRSLGRTRERLADALRRIVPSQRPDEETLDALEEALISADVGPVTAMRLVEHLRDNPDAERAPREQLRAAMLEMLTASESSGGNGGNRPRVILMVGVNGSGKTTSTAKLGAHFRASGQRVLLGAADTFRAAAVEQLAVWGERLGVPVIAHQPGGDPAAVVYDSCEAGRARDIDVVIIDTAGRLQTKDNLMAELAKMHRAAGKVIEGAPDDVWLVLDATTGQNGLRQAEDFLQHAGVTGLILAKLDGSARGGVALSIADQLGLPIRYVGTGEGLDDLAAFDAAAYVEGLLGEDRQG
ncbi:MAG: signal recognition particle-docking protein FtsY [Acidobacteriota bacterium]